MLRKLLWTAGSFLVRVSGTETREETCRRLANRPDWTGIIPAERIADVVDSVQSDLMLLGDKVMSAAQGDSILAERTRRLACEIGGVSVEAGQVVALALDSVRAQGTARD